MVIVNIQCKIILVWICLVSYPDPHWSLGMRLDLLCCILTMFSTDISTSVTDLYNVLLLYYMNCISLNFTVLRPD